MQRGSKNISSSQRPQIMNCKANIRNSNGRGFDGDGYVFKTAIKELRKEGWEIEYDRKKCSYFVIAEPKK